MEVHAVDHKEKGISLCEGSLCESLVSASS